MKHSNFKKVVFISFVALWVVVVIIVIFQETGTDIPNLLDVFRNPSPKVTIVSKSEENVLSEEENSTIETEFEYSPKWHKEVRRLKSLITIKDDPMEMSVYVSTLKCVRGLEDDIEMKAHDIDDEGNFFLRAFINREHYTPVYQMYNIIEYRDDWRFYKTVNYQTPQGLKTAPLLEIDRDVEHTSYRGLKYNEHVVFEIKESLLRELIKTSNTYSCWKYKLKSQHGVDSAVSIQHVEIAALLEVVDEYCESQSKAK